MDDVLEELVESLSKKGEHIELKNLDSGKSIIRISDGTSYEYTTQNDGFQLLRTE